MFRKPLKPEKQSRLTVILIFTAGLICVFAAGCTSNGSLMPTANPTSAASSTSATQVGGISATGNTSADTSPADVEPTPSKSDETESSASLNPIVTTDDLNKRLLANLDKTTDETVRYVFELSPDNLKVDTTWKGSFTGVGKKELLSIIRLKGVPHAGGLDCSVAAVYDAESLSLASQTVFPYDECSFSVCTDDGDRSYLLFSGATTYQGNSNYVLHLLNPAEKWNKMSIPAYAPYETQTNGRHKFKLLLKGIVAVSDAIFPTDGSAKDPKWKTSSFLKWNPAEKTLEDYTPEKWNFLWMNGFREGIEVSRNGNYAIVTREWISGRESGVLLYDVVNDRLLKNYDLPAIAYSVRWAPDSLKAAIGQTTSQSENLIILDVKSAGEKTLPNGEALLALFSTQSVILPYKVAPDRPDPQISYCSWSPDSSRVLAFYQWTDDTGSRQSGTFVYMISDGSIDHITQNQPDLAGGHLKPTAPEGFDWDALGSPR